VNGNLNFTKGLKMEKPETVKSEAPKMPKMTIEIPISFAQELVNYLQLRPYAEVYGFIAKLLQAGKQ
jgi:hypothetical protein